MEKSTRGTALDDIEVFDVTEGADGIVSAIDGLLRVCGIAPCPPAGTRGGVRVPGVRHCARVLAGGPDGELAGCDCPGKR